MNWAKLKHWLLGHNWVASPHGWRCSRCGKWMDENDELLID